MKKTSKRTLLSALALMAFLSCSSDTTSDDTPGTGNGPGNGGGTPDPGTPAVVDFGLPLANEDDGVVRAFPGAEGGGMYTTGGRGGKVYHVTKLTDDGTAGTLRHAVEQSGARTIVFDVAGTIALSKGLEIKKGDLTIAGQTAPGDGICLRDFPVTIKADNVIIRYLRFRMGDTTQAEDDALGGKYHSNIVIDHCSVSWCTDECASFYANRNFTMQWCIISESLNNSVHGKGAHGYGGIWGGGNASFHHNLLAHHKSRNPRFDHPYVYDKNNASIIEQYGGHVDFRNNAIYNWGDSENCYGGEMCEINMVNNYFKEGPASKSNKYFFVAYGSSCTECSSYGYTYEELLTKVYADGNLYLKKDGSQADFSADNYAGIYDKARKSYTTYTDDNTGTYRLPGMLSIEHDGQACYTTTHSAEGAFDAILAYAGASLKRDAVDKRAVDDARSGKATITDGGNGSTDGIIDTQSAVGGWPELTATDEEIARAKDSDGDGIPDYYEELFGLDKNNAADGNAKTLDPKGLYTNLEVYLHYLVRDITAAQVEGGTYTELK
ncbi:pectate lyase [uncultured Alistipes sp.]|uniref:pectate lyase family protein n=1 Tax=uncultured Alistipes sp. TaxID=538949 RepID=UPI0026133650|nr:pectate lyase [uncultured Alistipes sp.]